jgi:hypothetical protein
MREGAFLICPLYYLHYGPLAGCRQHTPRVPASQRARGVGIALVHRIPPVGLKCVSEWRRREMAALVGGGPRQPPVGVKSAPYAGSRPLLRCGSSHEERF